GYAANIELAESVPAPQPPLSDAETWTREDVSTPEKRTVDEVSGFLRVSALYFIKSLLLWGKDGPFLALVRGNQELQEKKLQKIVGDFRTAQKDEVKDILGVEAGFIGPHNNELKKIADISLKEGIYISGANKKDFHTKGLKPSVHFKAEWHDIHVAQEGEGCPRCGSAIMLKKAIEIGNTFKLGRKYSEPLKALYLDEKGKEVPIVMGSYGIGPARIAAAAIEQNHDKDGMIWPLSIAPFDVEIIPLNTDDRNILQTAEQFYNELKKEGIEVLIDDRDERPGVKFKDADLIGIPLQLIVGGKNLKDGIVEIKYRSTKAITKVLIQEAVKKLKEMKNQLESD
ncbi:MAG: proline--tRNA ligase, partial [Thermodesulfovibrionia bacterium]|nr:proline--tRNA ligase [Thermodesulfovibrionia bacterium]